MKKITEIATTALIPISACGIILLAACGAAPAPQPAEPPVTEATNVIKVKLPGLNDTDQQVIIFDVVRDGKVLTCSTKQSFRAGVSCIPK